MIEAGLCSVTFREWTCEQVVAEAVAAGLGGIEWGGDVHVPTGDLARAERVGEMTRAAGLRVVSYGSYFRIGGENQIPLAEVLATAEVLGARVVRVWPGTKDAEWTPRNEWERLVGLAREAADLAANVGLVLACEWHAGTVMSTNLSGETFLREVGHPALRTYWQPAHFQDTDYLIDGLRRVRGHLENLHVFHWWPTPSEKRPLAEGTARWERFFAEAVTVPGDRHALLEFLPRPTAECLREESAALQALLAKANAVTRGPKG